MVEACQEVKVVFTGGNDWTIVAKKFLYGLVATFLTEALPYTIEFLQNEDLSTLPLWFAGLAPFIVGILLAIQNAWVHREQITFVDPVTNKVIRR
jgi:hypothetical protein